MRKITRRAFDAAVESAAIALRLAKPVHVRMLSIDFEKRTIDIDGRRIDIAAGPHSVFVIPLIDSERLVVARGPNEAVW